MFLFTSRCDCFNCEFVLCCVVRLWKEEDQKLWRDIGVGISFFPERGSIALLTLALHSLSFVRLIFCFPELLHFQPIAILFVRSTVAHLLTKYLSQLHSLVGFTTCKFDKSKYWYCQWYEADNSNLIHNQIGACLTTYTVIKNGMTPNYLFIFTVK